MVTKLKPCPFCGKVPTLKFSPGSYGYYPPGVFISCCNSLHVGADTETYDWDKKQHFNCREEAIEKVVTRWNTRHQ